MAVKACPDCGTTVSKTARRCPQCGGNVRSTIIPGWLAWVAIAAAVVYAFASGGGPFAP